MDPKASWYLLVSGMIMAAACLAGCTKTDPSGRQAISGTVTLQGKPLDRGTISFTSLDPKVAALTGAMIKDGKFSVSADKGLPPGTYRVRISSADTGSVGTASGAEAPGESGPAAKERIPPEFGTQSKQEVTITKDGKNYFEFNIP